MENLAPPRYGRGYLKSAWWAELHEAYERHPEAPHCCAVCATPRYQLHHRTYENLGHEHISDLLALCSVHHHGLHRAWRTHQRYHPEDTLAAFTDAWVLIQRRRYGHAPLPSLRLYGRAVPLHGHQGRSDRAGAAVAGRPDGGARAAQPALT
jgi:hypothetical protein